MIKNVILISCFCLVLSVCSVNPVIANDDKNIGIGISYHDYGTLYMPIYFSPNFFIEPEISFQDSSEEIGNNKNDSRRYTIGSGFFFRSSLKYFDLYYGARLGYQRVETSYNTQIASNTFLSTALDENGYFISPALGAEYFFSKNISISGEAQFRYLNSRGDVENSSATTKTDEFDTFTKIILRYYF